jgi:hypothetical protein
MVRLGDRFVFGAVCIGAIGVRVCLSHRWSLLGSYWLLPNYRFFDSNKVGLPFKSNLPRSVDCVFHEKICFYLIAVRLAKVSLARYGQSFCAVLAWF